MIRSYRESGGRLPQTLCFVIAPGYVTCSSERAIGSDFVSDFIICKPIEMKIPAEFLEFSLQFYQDLLDDVSNEEDLIRTVLSPFKDKEKRARLKKHLEFFIGDEFSDEELRKLWWSSSADVVFYDGAELRAFLKRVRDGL